MPNVLQGLGITACHELKAATRRSELEETEKMGIGDHVKEGDDTAWFTLRIGSQQRALIERSIYYICTTKRNRTENHALEANGEREAKNETIKIS